MNARERDVRARHEHLHRAIHCLVANEHPLQAAMLSRPLFEDMIVAHGMVLHDEDPHWLIERFLDHRDAMRLAEARARRKIGWSEPNVDDIIEREAELIGRRSAR